MDASRTPLSPSSGLKRRRASPTSEYGIPSTHHSQTSLPSFKQLEPYLRPQHMSSESPSSYPYSATSHYAPHTGQPQQQQESATSSQTMGAPQRDSAVHGAGDSEADEVDHHSPPKKKRRRQALSCTGDCFFYPPSLGVFWRWQSFSLLSPCPITRILLIDSGSSWLIYPSLMAIWLWYCCLWPCDWHHAAGWQSANDARSSAIGKLPFHRLRGAV